MVAEGAQHQLPVMLSWARWKPWCNRATSVTWRHRSHDRSI